MKANQIAGGTRRLMYIEKKGGDIDGAAARIGWVTFSPDGLSVYYRGRTLTRAPGEGIRGSYHDEGTATSTGFSRVKKTGSHAHFAPGSRSGSIRMRATSTGASAQPRTWPTAPDRLRHDARGRPGPRNRVFPRNYLPWRARTG